MGEQEGQFFSFQSVCVLPGELEGQFLGLRRICVLPRALEGQFFCFPRVSVLPLVLVRCKRGTLASFPVFNEKTEIFLA